MIEIEGREILTTPEEKVNAPARRRPDELADATADELVEAIVTSDPRWVADPHRFYAALRNQAPVYWSSRANAWIVSGYDDVVRVGRHQAISTSSASLDPRFATSATLQRFASLMVYLDPPEHTRSRRVTRARLTKRSSEAERGYVEGLIDGLLSQACEARAFDYMKDLAYRISVGAICHVLGVPAADHDLFAEWNALLLASVFPGVPDEQLARADEATLSLEDYLRGLMAERRTNPKDDLLSLVLAAQEGEDPLSDHEALGVLVMLFIAGVDTSANLIASGTIALLEHPDEMRKLRSDPSLVHNAIEEFVRYNGIVQVAFPRFATDDALRLANGSVAVAKGDQLLLLWPAADRDPAKFERPDELDIERANAKESVGWGHGLHLCLGANLARLTTSIAFTRLLARFKEIELLDDPIPWLYGGNVRRLYHLAVSVVPA